MEVTRAQAWETLTEYTKSEALRRHALAVEAAVGWYARDALPAMDGEFLRRIASALDEGPEASFVS